MDFAENDLIEKAKDCFNKGEFKKAQALFIEALEKNSKSVEAHFFLGNIFYRFGELGSGIKSFRKALELDPTHTDAAISLSIIYNDIGKYDEGKKIFDQASEHIKKRSAESSFDDKHLNKKFSQKHFELAELYLSYNRLDEALFEYRKATTLDPENLETRVKAAKVLSKKGFIGKAFEELRKIKTENPHYVPARMALGILHYGNGNVIEAVGEWEKAVTIDPTNKDIELYLQIARSATVTNAPVN